MGRLNLLERRTLSHSEERCGSVELNVDAELEREGLDSRTLYLGDILHSEDWVGSVEAVEGGHLLVDGLQALLWIDPRI